MLPINHAVPGALMELLRGTPLSDGKVTFAWNVAVGPALERVSSAKLQRGVLYVETVSPQWSREIHRARGVILKRLKALLGDDTVTRLEIRS